MIASFPALVGALALLLYVVAFAAAGRARHRFDVKAPSVTGPPEFEWALRVQQNTLEQIVWFIPSLWLFAQYVSPGWGGVIGLVWIAGRAHYARAYYSDPETRGPGFMVGAISSGILLVGALIGIIGAIL